MKTFTLSIVSHGHKNHIEQLFEDLSKLKLKNMDIILTLNILEDLPTNIEQLPFPIRTIFNDAPKGFAENHNHAFGISQTNIFIILNPDIRLISDPFTNILAYLEDRPHSICAPLVINQLGEREDSARLFPTPFFLFKKLIYKIFGLKLKLDSLSEDEQAFFPDWIAGMFIAAPSEIYRQLNGLNEHYHMYYEDVDFSLKARLAGFNIAVLKNTTVIHEAQRDSHSDFRFFLWHLESIAKFFLSKQYWQFKISQLFLSIKTHLRVNSH